jgi:hypothetical protein
VLEQTKEEEEEEEEEERYELCSEKNTRIGASC